MFLGNSANYKCHVQYMKYISYLTRVVDKPSSIAMQGCINDIIIINAEHVAAYSLQKKHISSLSKKWLS